MEPLIRIETVPISIEYVEKQTAKPSANSALLHISQSDNNVSIKSKPIKLHLSDSFEFKISSNAMNLSYTATANYSDNGNLRMNVHFFENSTSDDLFQKIGRDMENIIDILPKEVKPFVTYENIEIDFDMNSINGIMETGIQHMEKFNTSFMPPQLEIKVLERPRVIIKYVGGPIYIPRSSDPDYIPPKEINQIFDGKPNLDVKA